jgi:DNA-binding IclR family transcriptional regulator
MSKTDEAVESAAPAAGERIQDAPHDAASKVLRALVLLGSTDTLRVSDVARELDVAPSTAHRLLATLLAHGFAIRVPGQRRYRLGPTARYLTRSSFPYDIPLLARPHLQQLAAAVGQTVNLVVLDGPDQLFVDGVEGQGPIRVAPRAGGRVPAYVAAGGKAMLARLPDDQVRELYPGGLVTMTERTLGTVDALVEDLHAIRERGFALNVGENHVDVSSIGAAILDAMGDPVAAVTVAVPTTQWDLDRLSGLAPQLLRAADAIQETLQTAARQAV